VGVIKTVAHDAEDEAVVDTGVVEKARILSPWKMVIFPPSLVRVSSNYIPMATVFYEVLRITTLASVAILLYRGR